MIKRITLFLFLFIVSIQPSFADLIPSQSENIRDSLFNLIFIAISLFTISGLSLLALNTIKLLKNKNNNIFTIKIGEYNLIDNKRLNLKAVVVIVGIFGGLLLLFSLYSYYYVGLLVIGSFILILISYFLLKIIDRKLIKHKDNIDFTKKYILIKNIVNNLKIGSIFVFLLIMFIVLYEPLQFLGIPFYWDKTFLEILKLNIIKSLIFLPIIIIIINFIRLYKESKDTKEFISKRTRTLLTILVIISFLFFNFSEPLLIISSMIIIVLGISILFLLYRKKIFKKRSKESIIEDVNQQGESQ